ncbi:MAG: YHS domain-containing (seleno)protein [Hyphomicrobiales bacterium]
MNRRFFIAAAALATLPRAAFAAKPELFTGLVKGVAVGGHDSVSYFMGSEPRRGEERFSTVWRGAAWRFANQENLDAFTADPAKYAPQYGGYCAYAVSRGYTAKGDPIAWTVVDGKLYLNYSLDVRKTWAEDIPGNIAKADGNWPGVLN